MIQIAPFLSDYKFGTLCVTLCPDADLAFSTLACPPFHGDDWPDRFQGTL